MKISGGRKTLIWILIPAFAVLFFFALSRVFKTVDVETETVSGRTLVITVASTSTGTVKSDEEVRVTARRTGIVSRLYVEEGDGVEKGALLAEFDSEESLTNLGLSEAALRRAEAALTEAKTAFEPLRVEVESAVLRAEAALVEADIRLKGRKELYEKGYASKMELEAVKKEYYTARANHDSALAGRKQLEAKAEEIKARQAAVDEAGGSLSLAKLNQEYSFIRAPMAGVVTSRPVKLGETVPKGGIVASVVSMDSLYIEAFIDEADVDSVRPGQTVEIRMDAYPDRRFEGEVYMVSPVVLGGKHEARTFEARSRMKAADAALKPGMSADVEVVVDKMENVLVVPSQSVMEKDGESFVFVKKGSRARLRKVSVGSSNWTFTEVLSGVKEGEDVVVNPDAAGLKDGARVRAD